MQGLRGIGADQRFDRILTVLHDHIEAQYPILSHHEERGRIVHELANIMTHESEGWAQLTGGFV